MANLSISPKKMHIPPFIKKVAIGVPTYDHCCVFSHSPLFFNPHSSKEAQLKILIRKFAKSVTFFLAKLSMHQPFIFTSLCISYGFQPLIFFLTTDQQHSTFKFVPATKVKT